MILKLASIMLNEWMKIRSSICSSVCGKLSHGHALLANLLILLIIVEQWFQQQSDWRECSIPCATYCSYNVCSNFVNEVPLFSKYRKLSFVNCYSYQRDTSRWAFFWSLFVFFCFLVIWHLLLILRLLGNNLFSGEIPDLFEELTCLAHL